MGAAAERTLRSDAARNRAEVVAAAGELFAARGLDVGIPAIAERAGVGKATVYRSFPTKHALIAAVLEERMTSMVARAEAAARQPDAGAAFRDFVLDTAELQAGDLALADAMALKRELVELREPLEAVRGAVDALVEHAQQQGALRADVSGADVRLQLGAVTQALAGAGERDADVWRRHLTLVVDGLAPRAPG